MRTVLIGLIAVGLLGCNELGSSPPPVAAIAADAAPIDLDAIQPDPVGLLALDDDARDRHFRRILHALNTAPAQHTAIRRHGDHIALAYWLARDPDIRTGALALWAQRSTIDRAATGDRTAVRKSLASMRARFAAALGSDASRLNPY